MKKYQLAIEHWDYLKVRKPRLEWLEKNYGEPGSFKEGGRWYVDHDYDLVNLVMDEDIYTMFSLRWL